VHGGGIAEVARFRLPTIGRWNLCTSQGGERDGENESG